MIPTPPSWRREETREALMTEQEANISLNLIRVRMLGIKGKERKGKNSNPVTSTPKMTKTSALRAEAGRQIARDEIPAEFRRRSQSLGEETPPERRPTRSKPRKKVVIDENGIAQRTRTRTKERQEKVREEAEQVGEKETELVNVASPGIMLEEKEHGVSSQDRANLGASKETGSLQVQVGSGQERERREAADESSDARPPLYDPRRSGLQEQTTDCGNPTESEDQVCPVESSATITVEKGEMEVEIAPAPTTESEGETSEVESLSNISGGNITKDEVQSMSRRLNESMVQRSKIHPVLELTGGGIQRALSEGDLTAEKEAGEVEHYSEGRIPGESTQERLDEADPIDAFTRDDSIMAERIRQLSQQLLDKTEAEIESKEGSSSEDTEVVIDAGPIRAVSETPTVTSKTPNAISTPMQTAWVFPQGVEIVPIRHNPGLYYENLGQIQLRQATWQIVIHLDVENLILSNTPKFNVTKVYKDFVARIPSMASLKSIETIVDATVPINDVLDQFRSMGPADKVIIVPHGKDKKKTKYVFHFGSSPSSMVVAEAKIREKESAKCQGLPRRVKERLGDRITTGGIAPVSARRARKRNVTRKAQTGHTDDQGPEENNGIGDTVEIDVSDMDNKWAREQLGNSP
ncbi:hypothetical protein QAD02_002989 [Eretmocerus hayati]|uniref:Uncharacterized protein n=1 Tax=Eretmocerus hayati TaxID=131215 RepID=A0ACC2NQB8_9HYME|nr:hypothetical protein QAD02_002989 [Eretmocerus hayati]